MVDLLVESHGRFVDKNYENVNNNVNPKITNKKKLKK